MAERTVLLDATAEVRGAHLTLIANGTVAVVSAADFPPGKYPTDIVGRLLEELACAPNPPSCSARRRFTAPAAASSSASPPPIRGSLAPAGGCTRRT